MQQGAIKFILLSISITVIGLIFLLTVIFLLSPYQKGIVLGNGEPQINLLSIIGSYISLFIFFTGLFSTIFFWLRDKINSPKELYISATTSLRQGALMGILICILLLLQSLNLLIWWDALLVITAIILIEMYLSVK